MNAQCCCFHTSTLPAWHRLYSRPTSTCRLRHVHSRLSTNTPQSHQGRQHHTDKQAEQHQHQQFDSLVKQLLPLSYTELQQLQADATDSGNPALSASFLFWLSAQEKAALGTRKQELANLAAQLVYIKEQAEFEASRRQLPPLASSLAYSNYSQWQSNHEGQQLPDVTPGVTLTDLYKAAEREEAKLKQWQSPQRSSSTLDAFAASSGYQQMAADAMARVRARLMGFDDDDTLQQHHQQQQQSGEQIQPQQDQQQQEAPVRQPPGVSPAAARVLHELLVACCCREERATLLPEAFMPPGLEVCVSDGGMPGSSSNSSSNSSGGSGSSNSSSGGSGNSIRARVVTTPRRLLEAIAARVQAVAASSAAVQPQAASAAAATAAGAAGGEGPVQQRLPSGEACSVVLMQLREDIEEYDLHVYSRMSQRQRHGLP